MERLTEVNAPFDLKTHADDLEPVADMANVLVIVR